MLRKSVIEISSLENSHVCVENTFFAANSEHVPNSKNSSLGEEKHIACVTK